MNTPLSPFDACVRFTRQRRYAAWLAALAACLLSDAVQADSAPAGFDLLSRTTVVSDVGSSLGKRPMLLIHFHGAPHATEKNFQRAAMSGVLVTVNCQGLSSAYRRPFEDDQLFGYLLESVRHQLVDSGRLANNAEWGRVDVSCFSAGYGAVRELLKHAASRDRIEGVVAVDSIYASIHKRGDHRIVDKAQMAPFLEFARQAIAGEKMLLVSHSQLAVEPYASTVETAGYLMTKTHLTRRQLASATDAAFAPSSEASAGRFSVLGYPGADGEAHLRHLREISVLWQRVEQDRQQLLNGEAKD